MRAAIYARVSSESQASRGTICSQLALLEAKVADVGDELVARFVDDGHSGTRLDRPGLDALRDGAQAGIFERVWVLTADRLARNFAYQMLVLDELSSLGVEVCFTDAPPIADDPQARLLVQVQGVIAEYERAKMTERQRRGKLYRVRCGEAIFTIVPYGYRRRPRDAKGPARYEIFEPEAVVVRRIFDDYVAGGLSVRQLVMGLAADNIPSPMGRALWSVSTLGGLLRNSSYMGKAYWYRRESVPAAKPTGRQTRQVPRPREQWVEVAVPAIISEDTYAAAQRIASRNIAFSARRAPDDRWLLRGLVVCGRCGVKCGCDRNPKRSGGHNHYYVCAYRNELTAGGPERRCRERNIRADELDAFVFAEIREAMLRPELLTAGETALVSREPLPDDELLAGELARLQRRLDDAEREHRRLLDVYQTGLIELEELSRRTEELAGRQQGLAAQRERLVAERGELTKNNRLRKQVGSFAEAVAKGIDELDFAGRQRLMRIVVENVRVSGWQVDIALRIPLDGPPPSTPRTRNRPRSARTSRPSRRRVDVPSEGPQQLVFSQDRLRSLDRDHFLDALRAGDPSGRLHYGGSGTSMLSPAANVLVDLDKWLSGLGCRACVVQSDPASELR
jgi:site-specific DNA recombinase